MGQKMPLKSGSKAVINFEKCKSPDDCLKCAGACKLLKAITRGENGFPIIDIDRCKGCDNCMEVCPNKAIEIHWLEGTQSDSSHKIPTW